MGTTAYSSGLDRTLANHVPLSPLGFLDRSADVYPDRVAIIDGKLRQTAFPLTTADLDQYRPHVTAGRNTFLSVWTDYRDTANEGGKHDVYEYYGRVIGNDMALSSRWRNPQSK